MSAESKVAAFLAAFPDGETASAPGGTIQGVRHLGFDLSPEEVAELIGVSRAWVLARAAEGDLPVVRGDDGTFTIAGSALQVWFAAAAPRRARMETRQPAA